MRSRPLSISTLRGEYRRSSGQSDCFPIPKDFPTYEAERGNKVNRLRPEAIAEIDALKPYKGGNEVLWKIHELDIIDKHKVILSIADDCPLHIILV